MDKAELLRIHQQQNDDNKLDTQSIISILGGINNVLTLILSSNDININKNQISDIHKIITNKPKYPIIKTNKSIMNENEKSEWTYYFHKNNTYLHSLFSKQNADKILGVIYSKYCVITLLLITITQIIVDILVAMFDNFILWIFYLSIYSVIYVEIIIVILYILSANTRTYSLVRKRFEFWIKLYYAIQKFICTVLYPAIFNRYWMNNYNETGTILWTVLVNIPGALIIILLIITMSFWDGMPGKLWFKSAMGILMAIYLSYSAIWYNFYSYINGIDPSIIYIKSFGISFSVYSINGSANQILAVFVWKQAIMSIFKKGKCLLIHFPSPYITWIDDPYLRQNKSTNNMENSIGDKMNSKQLEMHITENNVNDDPINSHYDNIDIDELDKIMDNDEYFSE